jgi:hypothetical protein
MFDKYVLKMEIFGINISLYYIIILFLGIYLDTVNGLIIISILALIQDITIGVNFGNIIISTLLSFLILKKINKILYEEKLLNVIIKNIVLYFSYILIYIMIRYIIYNNKINYVDTFNIMLKEILIMTLIVIVIYPIFKEIGTYIGKRYKKRNIITKYF